MSGSDAPHGVDHIEYIAVGHFGVARQRYKPGKNAICHGKTITAILIQKMAMQRDEMNAGPDVQFSQAVDEVVPAELRNSGHELNCVEMENMFSFRLTARQNYARKAPKSLIVPVRDVNAPLVE